MRLTSDQAAAAVIEAKAEKAKAETRLKKAEAQLKESFGHEGITFTVVFGTKVQIVESARSTFDTEKLQGLVSSKVFNTVTTRKIDSDLFRSAVTLGTLKPEIADMVTEVKITTSVRVNELKGAQADIDTDMPGVWTKVADAV